MVLPYIKMNLPQVYTCSPSWTFLPPPFLYHPSGSSQCTSPKHPVSCIELGLVIHLIHDIMPISMPFSQIIPPSPSPSPTESKRLFYTSVSLLLSHIQGYHYHLSKFHIYVLVYCIGVFLYPAILKIYIPGHERDRVKVYEQIKIYVFTHAARKQWMFLATKDGLVATFLL